MATTAPSNRALKAEVLAKAEQLGIKFVSLQFTDIVGVVKNVTIPIHKFEDAIDYGLWFDGSSIEGFARIHESDMYLEPDLTTFGPIPWEQDGNPTAKVICNVYTPDGTEFTGDPRYVLRRMEAEAARMGFVFQTGPELEFFLLRGDRPGVMESLPHDRAGYFDVTTDEAAEVRKEMVNALEAQGIDQEERPVATDDAPIAQAARADLLAARGASEHDRFDQEEPRVTGELDLEAAVEPAAVEQDRLLRQPEERPACRDRKLGREARLGAEGAVDLLGRLARGEQAGTRTHPQPLLDPIARGDAARGVDQHGLERPPVGDAGKARLGTAALAVDEERARALAQPDLELEEPSRALQPWRSGRSGLLRGRRLEPAHPFAQIGP